MTFDGGCCGVACLNVGGESRCNGADSSSLYILKPQSPLAAEIEAGGCSEGDGCLSGVYW